MLIIFEFCAYIWYNKHMKNWLYNNVVLVTGASSGIGKEISKELINKYNCTVLGVARNEEKLKNFAVSLQEKSNKFEYICADVSKEESWQKIFDFAKEKNCSILINNAGTILPFESAEKTSIEQITRVFNTNFFSAVYAHKAFCNYFREKGGCGLINIASVSAVCSLPGASYYSASKSALTSFSKIIASEERKNFFVGTYLPGTTQTNLFTTKDNANPVVDEKAENMLNKISMSAEKMAKKIVKCIAKKKKYKVLGIDAKLLKFANNLMPIKSSDLYLKIYKKTKLDCFKNVYSSSEELKQNVKEK